MPSSAPSGSLLKLELSYDAVHLSKPNYGWLHLNVCDHIINSTGPLVLDLVGLARVAWQHDQVLIDDEYEFYRQRLQISPPKVWNLSLLSLLLLSIAETHLPILDLHSWKSCFQSRRFVSSNNTAFSFGQPHIE